MKVFSASAKKRGNSMSYNDILSELRAKLGDSPEENDKLLREEGMRFAKEGNVDGVNAASELLLENMPEGRRKEIDRLTHLDGERLDQVYDRINQFMREHDLLSAKALAAKLYKKITLDYPETEDSKHVSLRNPFEDELCQHLFPTEKTLNRTPFDFSAYLTTYAFILLETGGTIDALPVLEKAISYNPVDVGPRFEMAEIYKLTKNFKKLFEVTKETLKICSSPVSIARCYANIGYALTDMREYEDAAAFYALSVMFYPDPAIPLEMQHLADLKGSPLVRPSVAQAKAAAEKHDIQYGPNPEVIEIAASLGSHFLLEDNIPDALRAMKIAYNLTLDEKIKKIILKYEPLDPAAEAGKGSGITRTVNNDPEE